MYACVCIKGFGVGSRHRWVVYRNIKNTHTHTHLFLIFLYTLTVLRCTFRVFVDAEAGVQVYLFVPFRPDRTYRQHRVTPFLNDFATSTKHPPSNFSPIYNMAIASRPSHELAVSHVKLSRFCRTYSALNPFELTDMADSVESRSEDAGRGLSTHVLVTWRKDHEYQE